MFIRGHHGHPLQQSQKSFDVQKRAGSSGGGVFFQPRVDPAHQPRPPAQYLAHWNIQQAPLLSSDGIVGFVRFDTSAKYSSKPPAQSLTNSRPRSDATNSS